MGEGGEDPMVFQFLWTFSTPKSHHLPNYLPNFVLFHFLFSAVLHLMSRGCSEPAKKKISTLYKGFPTEKNDPNSRDF
jgi:hypothetical protein